MKKILYVCCNFVWGGVEQYILNVIDYIDKNKFQIDVLLPEKEKYEREHDLIERRVRVIKYPCNSMGMKVKSFRNIIKNGNYDVVHFHTGHESALFCLICYLIGNKNIVVHAHTSQTGDDNTAGLHLLKKRLIYKISNLIYKNIACCVACSIDAAVFMFGSRAKNVKILKNGINLEKFRQVDRKPTPYSICINARIDPQKNPFFVLEVVKELIKIESQVHLEWIGSGPLKKEIEQRIKDYKLEQNVSLLGTRDDVPQILARNEIFFFPSLYEELGIVLIEAQAAGLKCFISDAIPKSANCGACKVIPLKYDARMWAETIINEMKSEIIIKVDDNKLNEFDINYTVKELERLYLECSEGLE